MHVLHFHLLYRFYRNSLVGGHRQAILKELKGPLQRSAWVDALNPVI